MRRDEPLNIVREDKHEPFFFFYFYSTVLGAGGGKEKHTKNMCLF